ncbi:spore germination protein [Caldisalinibacter kiritimatiensis]|uniref:Spore germination protein GerKA n=1 Tax=Caldisalinibacter kiritimatiensis TaxID=1304284 RepID=R1CSQ0_9FIRM|nr:spore germination protein [Caldisalinibacter kiritimatiensis]EOD01686.1 Spore germination protein GerKA [Caldisalinibacter kiritimatiensis]
MGLFDELNQKNDKEYVPISKDIDKNIKQIKEELKDCDDIIYRDFKVGRNQKYKLTLIYVDGLIDKDLISENVLKALMQEAREVEPNPTGFRRDFYNLVKKGNISATEIKEVDNLTEAIDNILIGETILVLDKYSKIIVIGSRGWPTRSVQETQTETVIRGPRDGFTETAKVNTSLIRRRIRDTKLKLKYIKLGKRSKTDIAIMYIEDIVDKSLLKEVKKRLEDIEIDAILESSYIEQLIEDNNYSPFPQVENTERPDAVAASLYEGRIAIVIDNTPFVLLVPATMTTFLQSSEDYYDRWLITSLVRLVRYLASFVALLSPAIYIALTSYHPGMIPTQLALYVAATRTTVPFPAFIEAFIMEMTIEFLREAGTRLSGPIGTTIGIVGGLVIGQAAVEAGIVSPLMVIIVALTTIASFMLPSYGFAASFRILRFSFMVFAAALGLYGIMLGLILLGTHLVNLKSFGIPYLSPFVTLGKMGGDLKDTLIRTPINKMKKRPKYTDVVDEDRLVNKEKNSDKKGEK